MPEPLGSSGGHAGGLCPRGKPVSGMQQRGRPATWQAGGRGEAPWPRPRGRCRSCAAGALGARVPGRAGGRDRERRRPWEPDARAWCRWRRGQSRHRTLIFDLATGRCFAARCPPGASPSPGSGVSRSGARGDELLSAPPGSPALLLPPPLLLPPSLRQSSGGSWSRRPRPTAGEGRAPTHRHAASGPGARGSLTCGRCRRRPAPDLGTSPSGQRRGGGRERPGLGLLSDLGVLGAAPQSQLQRPRETEGPARLGTRAPNFLSLGWGRGA